MLHILPVTSDVLKLLTWYQQQHGLDSPGEACGRIIERLYQKTKGGKLKPKIPNKTKIHIEGIAGSEVLIPRQTMGRLAWFAEQLHCQTPEEACVLIIRALYGKAIKRFRKAKERA